MQNMLWECHLCSREFKYEKLPSGYLGNYHPICRICSDLILFDNNSIHQNRLTYHYQYGDLPENWQNICLSV